MFAVAVNYVFEIWSREHRIYIHVLGNGTYAAQLKCNDYNWQLYLFPGVAKISAFEKPSATDQLLSLKPRPTKRIVVMTTSWKDSYVETRLVDYPLVARNAGEVLLRFCFRQVHNEA